MWKLNSPVLFFFVAHLFLTCLPCKNDHPERYVEVYEEYNVDRLWNMTKRQPFIVNASKIPNSGSNPSIIMHPNRTDTVIVTWRIFDSRKYDKMGYQHLNRTNWEVIKRPDWLELFGPGDRRQPLVGEDTRLFMSNGNLYATYSKGVEKGPKKLYYTILHFMPEMDALYADFPEFHVSIDHEMGQIHQKNWIPFDYKHPSRPANAPNELFFIYSISPHRIVTVQPTTDPAEHKAHTIALTSFENLYEWKWGSPRGGTPAVRVGDHYLMFFHSSACVSSKFIATYFLGAYLFETEPPFRITHITPEPIMHPAFLDESPGWAFRTIDFVIFPTGIVIDDEYIYVSHGRAHREGWMIQLKKQEFLAWLRPVKSVVNGMSRWVDGVVDPLGFNLTSPLSPEALGPDNRRKR